MFIKHISLENIRNHISSKIHLEPNINILFGPNGSGKTSVLEAISIATFSRSFATKFDQNIVRNGEKHYAIEILAVSDKEVPFTIHVIYQLNKGKEIRDSSGQIISSQELIGTIPIVVLSPDMKDIVFGSPSSRRDFVDKVLSQTENQYLKKLIEYKRIVKQRNKLLWEIMNGNRNEIALLPIWNHKLIENASFIIKKRMIFTKEFSPLFAKSFDIVTNGKEQIEFNYSPFISTGLTNLETLPRLEEKDSIISFLNEQLERVSKKEIERGTTLLGPHKDDFFIKLNNSVASDVASQGQSKSILIALKYAEINFLQKTKETNPIVLFDDIFSELDLDRVYQVLNLMSNVKVQLLVTMTGINLIKDIIPNFETYGIFKVENGCVTKMF